MTVNVEGNDQIVKGRVNFYYRGQPYLCKECQLKHQEKCPQKIAKEAAEREGEVNRLSKVHTLIVGDSNLRRVNESAFSAKTDCATGAKNWTHRQHPRVHRQK